MPQGISPLHSHSSAADLDVKMETLAPKIERLRVCLRGWSMPPDRVEYSLQPPAAVSNGVGLANEYQLLPATALRIRTGLATQRLLFSLSPH